MVEGGLDDLAKRVSQRDTDAFQALYCIVRYWIAD